MMRTPSLLVGSVLLLSCAGAEPSPPPAPAMWQGPPVAPPGPPPASPVAAQSAPSFTLAKVMIPMRDGAQLETEIAVPQNANKPLPFLLKRGPYGVPKDLKNFEDPKKGPAALITDGYIFVWQNIRGRFNSGGTFVMGRPPRDWADPIDETTDAYDTIEWLLRNVPGHNGRVGMHGTSYDAWTATMALLEPHPALKVIIEQASPADLFLGDDFFHNGAFRVNYAFEYAALLESDKGSNTKFKYDRSDMYDWFLALGPLANANDRHFHGNMPSWNGFIDHSTYDAFWQRRALATHLRKTTVPVLNVAGWWDQEDFYGPLKIYELLEQADTGRLNYLVAGPWNHGGWHGPGRTLDKIDFESNTGEVYTNQVAASWLAYWLHDKGTLVQPEAMVFETGTNRWRSFDSWPPETRVTKKKLYLRAGSALSFDPPEDTGDASDSYISDPANPVPYGPRPIPALFQGTDDWRHWLVQDQRFADHRPDVLSFSTNVLDRDVIVAGEVVAELYASTTGSDSDWIVKLIDVYPEGDPPARAGDAKPEAPAPPDMRGYQLMIASEIFRGRFRESFSHPARIQSGKVLKYSFSLHSHSHAFLKGHRIMVQVQSSWFPVYDRNPQRFVDNIFKATEADFMKATQKISRSRNTPSAVILPILSE